MVEPIWVSHSNQKADCNNWGQTNSSLPKVPENWKYQEIPRIKIWEFVYIPHLDGAKHLQRQLINRCL